MARAHQKKSKIANLNVAIVGRLGIIERTDLIHNLQKKGAHFHRQLTSETNILILGELGWPLRENGHLPKELVKAQAFSEDGTGIEILAEAAFLERYEITEEVAELNRLYTTQQLAKILGVDRPVLDRWVRLGLVQPVRRKNRLAWFNFTEISKMRTIAKLLDQGAEPKAILASLKALAQWMDGTGDIIHRLEADPTGNLGLRLADGLLTDAKRQLLFDFNETDEATKSPGLTALPRKSEREPATSEPQMEPVADNVVSLADFQSKKDSEAATVSNDEADYWFEEALALENNGQLMEAIEAYQKCTSCANPPPEAYFNLGNAYYLLNRKASAAEQFLKAIGGDRYYVEAWNNLGTCLGDIGHPAEAITAFEQAISIEPLYMDAYFNLGNTYLILEEVDDAVAAFRKYLSLDPRSEVARDIRKLLEGLELSEE